MLFSLEGLLEQTHEGRFLCAACGVCRRRGAAAAARGSRACGLSNRRERICGDGAALPFAVAKPNSGSADACDRCRNDGCIPGIAPSGYAAASWHTIREFRSTFAGRGYPCRDAMCDLISPCWSFADRWPGSFRLPGAKRRFCRLTYDPWDCGQLSGRALR